MGQHDQSSRQRLTKTAGTFSGQTPSTSAIPLPGGVLDLPEGTHLKTFIAFLTLVLSVFATRCAFAADASADEVRAPHTPALMFFLSNATEPRDADAIRAAVSKLKTATVLEVNLTRGYAHIRFDSHVVSYHQVAQAINDAGATLNKKYDPYLIFRVPDYAKADHAADVDAIFAGKKLRTRVNVTPIDKSHGEFAVHFLPLKVDPAITAPQGFNGGHLHHPISDPAPHGLALESSYEEHVPPATQPGK
jgi:copper chaperone CopZ